MDAPTATLIAGVVTGTVGIVAAILAHLNLRYQLARSEREADKYRRHQIALATLPKITGAIEQIALLLHKAQLNHSLSSEQLGIFVTSLVWLPDEQRQMLVDVLKTIESDNAPSREKIVQAQAHLLMYAKELTVLIH
jgi:hypothetical protein